jgi:hypothetical protein
VIVSWPATVPAAAGSNTTASVDVCPGFKVMGSEAPDTVKPVPVSAAELMVTGRLPVDVKVTDFEIAVFTTSLPNARLVALALSVFTAASNCMAKVFEMPPWLAVRVTACAVQFHQDTVAVNEALVAFPGIVTEDGIATAELLLDRLTARPLPVAGALSVTVQASCNHPVTDA